MRKNYIALLLFLTPLFAVAETNQETSVNTAQQQETQAVGISGARVSQNFEASKQVPAPQFGINSSTAAVPIFSGATRPASQLFEAYESALDALNISRNFYFTEAMFEELENGIREDREHASVSFEPTEDFVVAKALAGNKEVVAGEHEAVSVPRFVDKLDIKGTYLGVINSSSYMGDQKTSIMGLKNTVKAFSHEKLSVFFPRKTLYLVKIPGGTGINIGVHTDSSTTGIFGSIGFPMGGASGAVGASHSESDGNTQYATTLGSGVLVFVDGGPVPIHLDFRTPVQQPAQIPVAAQEPTQSTSQKQEVVVRVFVDTPNTDTRFSQKAGYITGKKKKYADVPYQINE